MPIVSASTGLHETLALLTSQLHPDANHKEDLVFLKDVFSERSISYLMKIHEKLKQYEKQSPTPVLHSASCLAEDLAEELQNGPLEDDERELLLLLNTPHIKAVLSAHDTVAQKKFDPVLPPLPEDVDDDLEEESVKIVRLVKNKEPLGATIRRDEATGAVIVARIMRGGAADRSGLVHVGDELREVNGNLVTHKRPDEISQILSQSQGSITLKIIPAVAEEDKLKESRVYLRALFDYTPFEDRATPCQEAGLPFKRGDILQVVSQEDATWWQAKRVGDCNLRAALIPSVRPNASDSSSTSLRRSFRLRRNRQDSPGDAHTPDGNHSEFLIYEEVTQYLARPGDRPRLIVLIGGALAENTHPASCLFPLLFCFSNTWPEDTTRARKPHEREGVEYHFISKAAFEADIQSGKFIEFGEYKENLYGTSLESIHRILDQRKICLVDVQPEALKTLRSAEFKPYIVFVRPRIPESQRKQFGSEPCPRQEDDLQDMKQSADRVDECYGHWVDYVLVKEDPVSALAELQLLLERVQLEPQWVPVSWLRR
uniref:Membrane protein, palmitoylated 3b (MAGUK p55 subfamily member 3) n=1 Tax=Salarias fasciatus TaxID=181472 RepID=A0A672JAZ8_SALFA